MSRPEGKEREGGGTGCPAQGLGCAHRSAAARGPAWGFDASGAVEVVGEVAGTGFPTQWLGCALRSVATGGPASDLDANGFQDAA